MSCWPRQNCRGNTKSKSPGNTNNKSASFRGHGIDDDINRSPKSTTNKCGVRSRQKTWDEWYKHNLNVTGELAILMKAPIEEVAELLYSLTLQNYYNLLNPRGKCRNCRYIPLSCMDACDRYLTVFDLHGNLRDPSNPQSLISLLEFMQSIVREDPGNSTESRRSSMDMSISPSSIAGALATVNDKYKELFPQYDNKIYFMYSKRLARLIDPDVDKIAVAIKKRICVSDDQVKGHRGPRVPRYTLDVPLEISPIKPRKASQRQRPSDTVSRQISRLNRIADYPRQIAPSMTPTKADFMLSDEKGRRRGQGSAQLIDLRSKRAEFLRHLLQNMDKADPDGFLKSLGSVDLKNPRAKHRRSKIATEELANFYETVVTDQPKEKQAKEQKQPAKRKKADVGSPVAEQSDTVRERKYFGDPMPVLYHAPYQSTDESTWMRRHPEQLRMQEDGRLGILAIKRYKRDSVQQSLLLAQKQYSIHSLNSQKIGSPKKKQITIKEGDLSKKPEYKRVFPSISRRFKQSRQSKGH